MGASIISSPIIVRISRGMAAYKPGDEIRFIGKRKVGGIRYEARSPRHLDFLNLRNAQTIEPTTDWTAVSFASASTRYTFLHLNGLLRAEI